MSAAFGEVHNFMANKANAERRKKQACPYPSEPLLVGWIWANECAQPVVLIIFELHDESSMNAFRAGFLVPSHNKRVVCLC